MRTELNSVTLAQNNYAVQPGDLTLTAGSDSPFVPATIASDPINGNSFVPTGNEILLVQNIDIVDHTFTAVSSQDKLGRTSDLSYTVTAGSLAVFEYSVLEGWIQPDGMVYVNASDESILFAVLVHD